MTAKLTAQPAGDEMPDEFVLRITPADLERCLEWGGLECAVGDQILRVVFPTLDEAKEVVTVVAGRGKSGRPWGLAWEGE